MKERPEGLGRVTRSIPRPTEELDDEGAGAHPYRYDVDWVLGGRVAGVSRNELVHTTAEAEGMCNAPRRRRKPSSLAVEAKAVTPVKKTKKAVTGKKGETDEERQARLAKRRERERNIREIKKASGKGKGGKKGGAGRKLSVPMPDIDGKQSNALDLFEKHRREFERIVVRLKRADQFGFFFDDVPVEMEENYVVKRTDGGDASDNADAGVDADSEPIVCKEPSDFIYPARAPYNFTILQTRVDSGRYIIDRQRHEDEKRKQVNNCCIEWQKDAGEAAVRAAESAERLTSLVRSSPIKPALSNDDTKFEEESRFKVHNPKGIDWDLFLEDVVGMCNARVQRDPESSESGSGTIGHTANKIKQLVEEAYNRTGKRHSSEMELSDMRRKYVDLFKSTENNEAAMQSSWRKSAFPERRYERLATSNVVCAGLSPLDERSAVYELETSLPDSFVGLSYTYDDRGQSEGWMKTVVDEADNSKRKGRKKKDEVNVEREAALALSKDDGLVAAQVRTTMDLLLIGVQDRVMTDAGVLQHPEVRSANWDDGDRMSSGNTAAIIHSSELQNTSDATPAERTCPTCPTSHPTPAEVAEQPVWGMDCYTRKNVAIVLEADFGPSVALEFTDRWLLPAINSCPVDMAHDMGNAARVLEGLPLVDQNEIDGTASKGSPSKACFPVDHSSSDEGSHVFLSKALASKIERCGPTWLKDAAHQLRMAIETMGTDIFRIHPKGHGSVVLRNDGLQANSLVTYYRGEVYPPWRWGEKSDAIEKTQLRIGLRPTLPDFYNMALERPRVDPRGFGLLFVDASRKAGLGSSFSHSCEPTCEVKVVAVNGKLQLAMTTLRDLECGEELTFDYHAVTESVNEYHAAICLCGHRKCRGSFLHFAAADCYQQVLSRNAPIAVQFANIAKGCMKKIISKEDARILENHGLVTAAFGAVSFNHYRGGINPLDSLDYVPVWLRTFVADTLRYIEYERRALPIALLSNHFTQGGNPFVNEANKDDEIIQGVSQEKRTEVDSNSKKAKNGLTIAAKKDKKVQKQDVLKAGDSLIPLKDRKAIPGSKVEPAFFFFSRKQKASFVKTMREQGIADKSGLALNSAIQKIAGSTWRNLSGEKKQQWKELAQADWEKNGGEEKAKLEEARKLRVERFERKAAKKALTEANKRKLELKNGAKKKNGKKAKVETTIETNKISFEAADAEGYAAMEQRIHQLTQTLSRVGRVLDRHRETVCAPVQMSLSNASASSLRDKIHTPLNILSDEHVVGWFWNHPDGVIQTLLRELQRKAFVDTPVSKGVSDVYDKFESFREYSFLSKALLVDNVGPKGVGEKRREKMPPSQAREAVVVALLEMREVILHGLREMEGDAQNFDKAKRAKKREETRMKKEQRKREKAKQIEEAANALGKGDGNEVVASVEVDSGERKGGQKASVENSLESADSRSLSADGNGMQTSADFNMKQHLEVLSSSRSETVPVPKNGSINAVVTAEELKTRPWQKALRAKYKLESAADLLLAYAHTSTFFTLNPYCTFESTPIEVYARELGNSVPRSLVEPKDCVKEAMTTSDGNGSLEMMCDYNDEEKKEPSPPVPKNKKISTSGKPKKDAENAVEMCEPDEVITAVNVKYEGDYVLSCLLQWYLGGISLKSGLPDMSGSIVLPPMAGCWDDKPDKCCETADSKVEPSTYASNVRPKLLEWFEDRHQRGSPWSEDVAQSFPAKNTDSSALTMGSPIMDLLITGNVENIELVIKGLKGGNADKGVNNEKSKRLKKSAAERLQSSMDEGMPAQAVANWVQCENPKCMKWRKLPWHVDVDLLPEKFFCSQNVWNPGYDNCDAPEDDWDMNDAPVKFNEIPLEEFKPGAKFDVMRNKRDYYTEGTVIEVDFSTEAKKVHFRFKGMTTKWNEWIEATSKKIAPHLSYVKVAPEKKAAVKSKKVDKKSPAPNDDDSKKVASKSKKAKRKHPAPEDGESQKVASKSKKAKKSAPAPCDGESKRKGLSIDPKPDAASVAAQIKEPVLAESNQGALLRQPEASKAATTSVGDALRAEAALSLLAVASASFDQQQPQPQPPHEQQIQLQQEHRHRMLQQYQYQNQHQHLQYVQQQQLPLQQHGHPASNFQYVQTGGLYATVPSEQAAYRQGPHNPYPYLPVGVGLQPETYTSGGYGYGPAYGSHYPHPKQNQSQK